jgi:multidrug efflux pump
MREASLAVGGRSFRLGDIARVTRGLADPPQPRMRVAGRDAIGLGVVMARGGNVIDLGDNLSATMDRLQQDLPVGMDVHRGSTSRRSSRPRSTSSSAPWARPW